MELGELRLVERIHPDSIGVMIWEVEQVKPALGKYAKEGDLYWARVTPGIEPFTVKQTAIDYMNDLANLNT
jgi:hypothetical protein